MKNLLIVLFLLFTSIGNCIEKKAIILIGPPASGKGYLAHKISQNMKYAHISTGDLLRQKLEPKDKNIMNSGKLINKDIINQVIQEYIDSNPSDGYIFDGIPRSKEQIAELNTILKNNNISLLKTVIIECPENDLMLNMKQRSKKERRLDDNAKTIKKRITLYKQKSPEIIEYYKKTYPHDIVTIKCKTDNMYEVFQASLKG